MNRTTEPSHQISHVWKVPTSEVVEVSRSPRRRRRYIEIDQKAFAGGNWPFSKRSVYFLLPLRGWPFSSDILSTYGFGRNTDAGSASKKRLSLLRLLRRINLLERSLPQLRFHPFPLRRAASMKRFDCSGSSGLRSVLRVMEYLLHCTILDSAANHNEYDPDKKSADWQKDQLVAPCAQLEISQRISGVFV
jgi:hypothetical protein